MAAGRPPKYQPEYCQMLIDHMSKGFTFESFGGVVSASKDTLYHWAKTYPEFSDAKVIGRQKQLQKNEDTIQKLASGKIKGGSAAAMIFIMKNCHRWSERTEVEIAPSSLNKEDLLKEAQALIAQLTKAPDESNE